MTSPILVDEEDPLDDNDELPFTSADCQIRTDKLVTDEFEVIGFLGRGKFGEVKRCVENSTGREFAAKFISAPRPQDKKDVYHEIDIMKKLQHRRLIQLYQAFESKNEMCLILEIIYGGELFDRVISEDFILTEKACQCFIRQICEGIDYMHSCCIIHLDMKPENILCLSQSGNRIKIIDFGLARVWNPKRDLRVLFGTPEFMAPEVVQYEPITFATDMWSVGVICYVLLSGLSPFMGDTDADTLQNVIDGEYDFDYPEFEDISEDAKDLVSKLLVKEKVKRLSARECLEHQWLKRQPPPTSPTLDLSKRRLKTFVYRRKWQKIVNAIIALKRMGVQLKALRKSSLDALGSGLPILAPEVLATLVPEKQESKTEIGSPGTASEGGGDQTVPAPSSEPDGDDAVSVTSESVEAEKPDSTSSTGLGFKKAFFGGLSRKKSSKDKSKGKKNSPASADTSRPSEPTIEETQENKDSSTTQKVKNKTREPGGFFNMLKKQKDTGKDTKKEPQVEKTKCEKPVPKAKAALNAPAKPMAVAKPPPSPNNPAAGKPEIAPKPKKQRSLQRDSSVRRSTKVKKQGGKGEQYVSLEKTVVNKCNDVSDGNQTNDNAESAPDPSNKVNGVDSENGDEEKSSNRLPAGFATFSRVRDRIKFLEQKEMSNTNTITRRAKVKVQPDHGRAS